jgi:aminoglycoside 3-N-acetyltransferase
MRASRANETSPIADLHLNRVGFQTMTNETDIVSQLAIDLIAAGVRPGGALLVHSSLRALGPVPGGAETVIRGLLAALGDEGTLLLPSLSYQHVSARQPRFDVRLSPSNVGALAEYFRTRPGTQRSLHPTHSICAVGPLADTLLRDHLLDTTPCGPHSPLHLLPQHNGQILMLGCGLRPNTSMHGIEELVEPPYLFNGEVTYRLVDRDGKAVNKRYRDHNFYGYAQCYERVKRVMVEPELRCGRVLQAEVYVIEASALWVAAEVRLRENPLFFVDKVL